MNGGWLSIPQVAARKRGGESTRSTRRFLKRNAIPMFREGGRTWVLESDVDAAMGATRMKSANSSVGAVSLKDLLANASVEVLSGVNQ